MRAPSRLYTRLFLVAAAGLALVASTGGAATKSGGVSASLARPQNSIAAKRYCSKCATTYAGDLSRYRYVFMHSDEAWQLPDLKARNRGVKVLVYKNAVATADYAQTNGGVDLKHLPTGVGYAEAAAKHDEWFLRDTAGRRVEFSDYPGLWMMDWGSRAYQRAWVRNVIRDAKTHGWAGVFIDDVNWSEWPHLGGRTLAKYPTNSMQQEVMRQFLAYVGPRLLRAGLIALPNIFVEWPNGPSIFSRWIRYTSGAAQEYWAKAGDGTARHYTGVDWDYHQRFLRLTQRARKIYVGITFAPASDTESMEYARSTFLLDWNGGPSSMAFDPRYADPWNPHWTTDLGQPTGLKFKVGAAWRRNYERGAVVVNPTKSTMVVDLGRPFYRVDGSTVRSLTLPPGSGAVLLARPATPPHRAAADTSPPTTPVRVRVKLTTETTVRLSWARSRDNVRVAGYRIYRNGTAIASTARTTYALRRLTCGTRYAIAVGAFDAAGNNSPRVSIAAATRACATAGVVIAAAGDICASRTGCAPTATLLGQIRPARILALGDLAYPDGSPSDFRTYYDPNWGRFKSRTSPSPGNHEYHTPNARGYFDYFGSRVPAAYYSFDLGAWHLIALNSELSRTARADQEEWLRRDVSSTRRRCILAYWHRPLFSSGPHGSATTMRTLWEILHAAGADVVLNGHDHDYERFAPMSPSGNADPSGIREFVVGTGGASLYPFPIVARNSEVRNGTTFGVLKLTLRPARYEWRFVPVAGARFTDRGSGPC